MSRATIASRIRNAHPDHHAIARGMALGTFFVFLGKLVGAAKEMTVAWRYGVSEVVDAYLFVFNLVNWPVAVWFSVLVVVLVPLAAAIRERNPSELPRFRSELLGLTLGLGLILWALAELGLRFFLQTSVSGLSGPAFTYALGIIPGLSWIAFLGMPISLLSAWTMAGRRYTNTLLEGVPALMILLVLLATSNNGPSPLVWGTVLGCTVHLISLSISLARRGELQLPRFAVQSPEWSAFGRGFGIMLAGQALLSLTNVIDQIFAAHVGAGSIATLSYANRIVALILGLGATAVSRATLPVFSQAEARGSGHVSRVAIHWVALLFGLSLIAMIFGWLLAPWGVRLLFERGAFTARDSSAVTEVLRYGLFQVPIFLPSLVLVSVVSSRLQYTALFLTGVIGLVVKLVSNALLIPLVGLKGLVLANAVVYAFNSGFLFLVVKYRSESRLKE